MQDLACFLFSLRGENFQVKILEDFLLFKKYGYNLRDLK